MKSVNLVKQKKLKISVFIQAQKNIHNNRHISGVERSSSKSRMDRKVRECDSCFEEAFEEENKHRP